MDNIKTLYSRIENPIDNRNKWNQMLNIYSTSTSYDDFHEKITKKEISENVYYDREERNSFALMMWSIFKQNLLSLSEEQIAKEIAKKNFEADIYDVIRAVRDLESVKTFEKLVELLKHPVINKYYARLFASYRRNIVIFSSFKMEKKTAFNTALIVTIDSLNLYQVLKDYINQCINNEIDYYIKYNELGKEITVEFYSSMENIKRNEDILDVLKKENYTFFQRNQRDTLLLGNISEWIEIKNSDQYTMKDYSLKRSKILFRSFDSVVYEYVRNHLNTIVSYKDGRMNLIDYLATFVMEKAVEELLSNSIRSNMEYFLIANSEDLLNLKSFIKNRLALSMKDILKDRLYLDSSQNKIPLQLNNEKVIDIPVSYILCAIRNLTLTLIAKDGMIERAFRIRIQNECQFHKVDPEKFCLDSSFAKKIFFDEEKYHKYQQELDSIHLEVAKLNHLEKLLTDPSGKENRKEVAENMNELLELFED